MQKRWVQDGNITKAAWDAVKKTHCPNGLPVKNHRFEDCNGPVISLSEGFESGGGEGSVVGGLLAGGIAAGILWAVVPTIVKLAKN